MDRRSFLGRIGGLVAGGVAAALGKNVIAEEPEKAIDIKPIEITKEDRERLKAHLEYSRGIVQIYPKPDPTYTNWHYMASPNVSTTNTMPYGIDYWIENTA